MKGSTRHGSRSAWRSQADRRASAHPALAAEVLSGGIYRLEPAVPRSRQTLRVLEECTEVRAEPGYQPRCGIVCYLAVGAYLESTPLDT